MSSRSPVFIVGAPRSGTTLLYHMLLSAGDFAVYRAETHAYSLIGPRFGGLRQPGQRAAFWTFARKGYVFDRSGIPEARAKAIVLEESRDVGTFLGGLMGAIADSQGVSRWAECTPDHALFLSRIASDFPDARFVHMLRDGRDVALSLARQAWIKPLPLDSAPPEVAAAHYWEWLVDRTRREGTKLGSRFLELRYEALVQEPRETLARLGEFVDASLDYDTILERGIGSVSKPNTSYPEAADTSPLQRWRRAESGTRAHLQAALGPVITDFGYEPDEDAPVIPSSRRLWRHIYRKVYAAKHRARAHSPLGRWLINPQLLAETELG